MTENIVKIENFVEESANSCNCLVDYDVVSEDNAIFVRVFKWDKIAEFNEYRKEGDYIKESSEIFENIKNKFGDIVKDVELTAPHRRNLLTYGGFEHKMINILINE